MSFQNFLSETKSYLEKEYDKQQKNILRRAKQSLSEKSDEEIKKMYRIRYDNPKWNDEIISAIEREAGRRGIY